MNRIFEPRGYFTVPDGTEVSAFMNASDATQPDLPWRMLREMSIASGRIGARTRSWVHMHPAVTQVTYVTSGGLTVRMKSPDSPEYYELPLTAGQAVLSEPGTLFQLRNDSPSPATVLYIVSPPYTFEMADGEVVHDDALLVAKTWDELVEAGYDLPTLKTTAYDARAARAESRRRLAVGKGSPPPPLSSDDVISLSDECDHHAPDGSEIRLLVGGANGGIAHCVLPAGSASAAVRHRTVEELWYVLEGTGEVWRHRPGEPPRVDQIHPGDSLRIPVGAAFQFRASAAMDLKLLLASMPPWPGPQEAVRVKRSGRDQGGAS